MAMTERVVLEVIQLYSQARVPSFDLAKGIHEPRFNAVLDIVSDDMILQLNAYVYGREGSRASATEHVVVARLPEWLPRWLRRRWSEHKELTVETTPILVFPELELGDLPGGQRSVQIMRSSSWFDDADEPEVDGTAGWM